VNDSSAGVLLTFPFASGRAWLIWCLSITGACTLVLCGLLYWRSKDVTLLLCLVEQGLPIAVVAGSTLWCKVCSQPVFGKFSQAGKKLVEKVSLESA
jgi:hypothetical protein